MDRLLTRMTELPSPVIQVWGWPGTGKRELLEALLEQGDLPEPQTRRPTPEPGGARALARAEVDGEERLQATLDKPEVAAARWLVCLDLPPSAVELACRLLRPGQRLVGAGCRRLDAAELPVSFITPGELLLTREEGAVLWRALVRSPEGSGERGSGEPEIETGELVWRLTSGWSTPLRLAARAVAEGALELPTAEGSAAADDLLEALLDLPPLQSFLRHEVLEPLPGEVREALGARARGETPSERRLTRVLASYGWTPETSGGPPLPEILAGFLRQRVSPDELSPDESSPIGVSRDEPVSVDEPAARAPARRRRRPRVRPQVRIGLLGPPRVTLVPEAETDDEVEIHWPLKRALKVLAYLASSEELQAPRDDLTAALWPEDDEGRIARNFHPTLSHLRRTFHEAWEAVRGAPAPTPLLFVHDTYRLNPDIVWEVDVVELSAAWERGRRVVEEDPEAAVGIWRDAVDLVRGPFLAGTYDTWAEPLRELHQRRWLNLLRELADLYVRLDRLTEAVDAYRRVLIEDPLREPVHQALMEVYAQQGRRDLVRRQYDRLANLLAEELGVEPLPQTTEEYHRLMA